MRKSEGFGPDRIISSGDTKQSIFTALSEEYATDEEAFAAIVAEAGAKRKEME